MDRNPLLKHGYHDQELQQEIGAEYKKQGWHSRLLCGLWSGGLKFDSRIGHPRLASVLCRLSSFKYLGKEKISRKPCSCQDFSSLAWH